MAEYSATLGWEIDSIITEHLFDKLVDYIYDGKYTFEDVVVTLSHGFSSDLTDLFKEYWYNEEVEDED